MSVTHSPSTRTFTVRLFTCLSLLCLFYSRRQRDNSVGFRSDGVLILITDWFTIVPNSILPGHQSCPWAPSCPSRGSGGKPWWTRRGRRLVGWPEHTCRTLSASRGSFFSRNISATERNTYLKDDQKQEVGVGEPLELLEEVKGEEGEDVVFGGLDGIVLQERTRDTMWGQLRCWGLILRRVRFLYLQRSGKTGWKACR